MLQFLQTGKALYVLIAVCAIGILSKLITRSLYKRLIKETDNMAMTKNRNMKTLKQKLENAYRLNQTIINTQAYLEKQLYGFRFLKMSLDGWNNISTQAMLLSLFLAGVGSFLSYWYRADSYYIVLYGSMGILGALLLALMDATANVPLKRQQLSSALVEYVDNSVFVRAVRDRDGANEPASLKDTARAAIRDDAREASRAGKGAKLWGGNRESGNGRVWDKGDTKTWEIGRETGNDAEMVMSSGGTPEVKEAKVRELNTRDLTARDTGKRTSRGQEEPQERDGARKDIDYLKRSLEQIAASREKERAKDDWTRNLNPEEIKVLGEIIREYFSGN